jgi:hypothetical protein
MKGMNQYISIEKMAIRNANYGLTLIILTLQKLSHSICRRETIGRFEKSYLNILISLLTMARISKEAFARCRTLSATMEKECQKIKVV